MKLADELSDRLTQFGVGAPLQRKRVLYLEKHVAAVGTSQQQIVHGLLGLAPQEFQPRVGMAAPNRARFVLSQNAGGKPGCDSALEVDSTRCCGPTARGTSISWTRHLHK